VCFTRLLILDISSQQSIAKFSELYPRKHLPRIYTANHSPPRYNYDRESAPPQLSVHFTRLIVLRISSQQNIAEFRELCPIERLARIRHLYADFFHPRYKYCRGSARPRSSVRFTGLLILNISY
jgi:hypothetical protein